MKLAFLGTTWALAVFASVLVAQETVELSTADFDSGTFTINTDAGPEFIWENSYSPQIDSVELRDGKLYVERQTGTCCPLGRGGLITVCSDYHPGTTEAEAHCYPVRDVYAAIDGEVVLLETIEPEIEPARPRRVTWPDERGSRVDD